MRDFEVYLNNQSVALVGVKKMDKDEKLVRKTLVEVWIKILEKYAAPGAYIPPADVVWEELFHIGVEKAIDRVCDKHWLVFSFMIRERIEDSVRKGLNTLDLKEFIERVRLAQSQPWLLDELRQDIKNYVMEF